MGADALIPPLTMTTAAPKGHPRSGSFGLIYMRISHFFSWPDKSPCPARPRRGGRAIPEGSGIAPKFYK